MAEVRAISKALRIELDVKRDGVIYSEINVPTNKIGLINFLNRQL